MVVLLNSAIEQDFPGAAYAPGMRPATTKVSYPHCTGNIFSYSFFLCSALPTVHSGMQHSAAV